MTAKRKYGWIPQLPDFRDWQFTVSNPQAIKSVSLFDHYNTPPIYNQGNLGSCTANGLAGLIEFWEMNKGDKPDPTAELFMPSRLFIYYYERLAEGTIMVDSGASIRDGIKVLASRGVPSETLWPYDITKFTQAPPAAAIQQAVKFEILNYYSVDNTNKAL
jgi:C1A family cysteine protease